MAIAARRFRRRVVACRGNFRALPARQKSHHRRPMVSSDASQNQILFLGKARFGLPNPGSNFEMKPETRRMPGFNAKFEPGHAEWCVQLSCLEVQIVPSPKKTKFDFGMPSNSPSGDDGDSFGAPEAPAGSRDTRLLVGETAAQQSPLLSPDSRIATLEA